MREGKMSSAEPQRSLAGLRAWCRRDSPEPQSFAVTRVWRLGTQGSKRLPISSGYTHIIHLIISNSALKLQPPFSGYKLMNLRSLCV